MESRAKDVAQVAGTSDETAKSANGDMTKSGGKSTAIKNRVITISGAEKIKAE